MNAAMKFKVGDRVRLTSIAMGYGGEFGIVSEVKNHLPYPYEVDVSEFEGGLLFNEHEMELAE